MPFPPDIANLISNYSNDTQDIFSSLLENQTDISHFSKRISFANDVINNYKYGIDEAETKWRKIFQLVKGLYAFTLLLTEYNSDQSPYPRAIVKMKMTELLYKMDIIIVKYNITKHSLEDIIVDCYNERIIFIFNERQKIYSGVYNSAKLLEGIQKEMQAFSFLEKDRNIKKYFMNELYQKLLYRKKIFSNSIKLLEGEPRLIEKYKLALDSMEMVRSIQQKMHIEECGLITEDDYYGLQNCHYSLKEDGTARQIVNELFKSIIKIE